MPKTDGKIATQFHNYERSMSMRCRVTKRIPTLAALLSSLVLAILVVGPLNAQSLEHSQTRRFLGYDKAHEMTMNGTVQELIHESVTGAPVGLHLLVAGPQGMTDVHLGPYLSKDTQAALHEGVPVQIIGAMVTLHGKDYLLARQLIFSGRQVVVRTENGFLLPVQGQQTGRKEAVSNVELGGGAQ
jgi:hypothetical protein